MYQPSAKTIALLEDLERRIDPQVEEDFLSQWRSFLNGKFTGEIFTPKRKTVTLKRCRRGGYNLVFLLQSASVSLLPSTVTEPSLSRNLTI